MVSEFSWAASGGSNVSQSRREAPVHSQSSAEGPGHEAVVIPPSITSPVMESVPFDSPAQQFVACQSPAPEPRTFRGRSPIESIFFCCQVAEVVGHSFDLRPTPRRRTKPAPQVPRRSSRLAKKACGGMSAVAAAQNVLMKKSATARHNRFRKGSPRSKPE
jgi:hypothetical protein